MFEAYDLPTLTTVERRRAHARRQAAWFKDPDGNLVGMFQFDEA